MPVSCRIYYPCRPGIGCFPNFGTIDVDCIVNYPATAIWPVNIGNIINTYVTVVGNLSDLVNSWAGYIGAVIINIGIVNNGCTVNNIYYPGARNIIIVNVGPVDISLRSANPVIIRYAVIVAKRYTDADTWL